ncbi:MAG: hypothetical protein LQ337_006307 [Flavoplaca oasis]|nr:MAG: hypothetical protein LQ337_006307 [Flavoplaca oasis]
MPKELQITKKENNTHNQEADDEFDRRITHLTNLTKTRKFLHSSLDSRGTGVLRDKIIQELQALNKMPSYCSNAECASDDLLRLTALAKSLHCKHGDVESEESCWYEPLHWIMIRRIETMSLLDGPELRGRGDVRQRT